jgi:type II secretory pathway pseudopilin PulG
MKKAFTLLEIVFILVIIGVIASTILPRTSTNSLQEAATQVLAHIRYTQHLALVSDKFNSTEPYWYKKRWLIVFSNSVGPDDDVAYTIFSDVGGSSTGDPGITGDEIAINPQDPSKKLTGGYGSSISPDHSIVTQRLNLTRTYGVTNVSFSGTGCPSSYGTRLNFDHLGRPIKGRLGSSSGSHGNIAAYESDNLITSTCKITISKGTDNAIITITPETGYAKIIQYK